MARNSHYSPQISRHLVCALYYEAKERRMPMTRLVDELLWQALDGSTGMLKAREAASPWGYAVLYREATGHQEGGLEIHHLVKTKQPKLVVTTLDPVTPDQAQRLMRIMESYVAGAEAEDYVPSPGQHCAWCDYLRECRSWH